MLPLLDGLFPSDVITASGTLDSDVAPLMPEEELVIARSVFKRRREFAAGRQCARTALARMGIQDFPLLSGSRREPLWPEGVVGSISHSDSACVAAVASAEHYRGIGVDLESDEPLSADLVRAVCCPDEVRCLTDTPGLDPMVVARIVFCAKESVYKCQFPTTRAFLDFYDVSIRLDSDGGFRITRCRDELADDWAGRLRGRWIRAEGCLATAAWLVR